MDVRSSVIAAIGVACMHTIAARRSRQRAISGGFRQLIAALRAAEFAYISVHERIDVNPGKPWGRQLPLLHVTRGRCALPPLFGALTVPIPIAREILLQHFCRQRQKLPAHTAPSAEMHALSAANPDAPRSSCA